MVLKPLPPDPLYMLDRAVARGVLKHDGTVSDAISEGIGVSKTGLHGTLVAAVAIPSTAKLLRSNASPAIKILGTLGIALGAVGTMVYLESPRVPANDQ